MMRLPRIFTLEAKQFIPQIAIDSAVFPEGTSGQQLDVLARKALWKEGYNYLVGFLWNDIEKKCGLIVSAI